MKNFITFLFALFLCANGVWGQRTVLSQAFAFSSKDTDYKDYVGMNTIPRFSDWEFNIHCLAEKQSYMRVGSSSGLGVVTTPAIGLNGNAVLIIKASRIENIEATFNISIVGEGSIDPVTFTVGSESEYRPSAILLQNCTPSSKIRIEGTYGKFYLMSMKVYDIGSAVFYESFNYMDDGANEFNYGEEWAKKSLCDNYIDASFARSSETASVRQSKGNVFFYNTAYYVMPTIPLEEKSNVLLTFKISQYEISDGNNELRLSCGSDIETRITQFNSTDLDNTDYLQTKTLEGNNYHCWQYYSVVLTNMTNSTVLTFGGRHINLDDVMLTPIPSGLDQDSDNSAYIKGNAGQVRDVQLQRILTPNVWCPLCLPFDVTPESMATALGTSCELNTLASVSDGIFTFNTVSDGSTISAGTPFLVKTTAQVENPTFSGVTIKNVEAQEDGNETYKFVGTYSPVYLETDGSELFLGTDGDLYKPGTGEGYNRLGGLRAYFRVPTGAKARVMFNDVDGIETLSMPQIEVGDKKTYDLQGRPVVKGQTQRKHLIIEKGRKRLVTD